jgi:hypothetical protein
LGNYFLSQPCGFCKIFVILSHIHGHIESLGSAYLSNIAGTPSATGLTPSGFVISGKANQAALKGGLASTVFLRRNQVATVLISVLMPLI